MAIRKAVSMKNGLVLNYHRIAMINIEPNQRITILVHSYLDEPARNYEKSYANGEINGEPIFPYVDSEYIQIEYDEDMSIKKAYEVLKNMPKFKEAEDI